MQKHVKAMTVILDTCICLKANPGLSKTSKMLCILQVRHSNKYAFIRSIQIFSEVISLCYFLPNFSDLCCKVQLNQSALNKAYLMY